VHIVGRLVGLVLVEQQQVPANVIAGMCGFKEETYFEIEEPAAREAPKVKF